MNTCTLTVTNVMNADLGRKNALRNFVMGYPRLHEEFYETVKNDILNMTSSAVLEALDNFIKERGFTILNEKPYVALDEESNWYRVNVIYTIAM